MALLTETIVKICQQRPKIVAQKQIMDQIFVSYMSEKSKVQKYYTLFIWACGRDHNK
jgi:hypothetical protein